MSPQSEDPFEKLFFSRIPAEIAQSFSPAQLDAVKVAFGARSPGAHALDLRFLVPFGGRSWYVVLLAGEMRRLSPHKKLKRLFRPVWRATNAAIAAAIALVGVLALLIVLYVGKRALGIDLFPGFDMLPDRQIERSLR